MRDAGVVEALCDRMNGLRACAAGVAAVANGVLNAAGVASVVANAALASADASATRRHCVRRGIRARRARRAASGWGFREARASVARREAGPASLIAESSHADCDSGGVGGRGAGTASGSAGGRARRVDAGITAAVVARCARQPARARIAEAACTRNRRTRAAAITTRQDVVIEDATSLACVAVGRTRAPQGEGIAALAWAARETVTRGDASAGGHVARTVRGA